MTLPNLSEDLIRRYADPRSFERGEDYYAHGSVVSLLQRGQALYASVAGSEGNYYQTMIAFSETGVEEANCSCPYDWGGWCKHIVATLLTAIHLPQRIDQAPSLEQLLEPLDREDTQTLLQQLVLEEPQLIDAIERWVRKQGYAVHRLVEPGQIPRELTVDLALYRRQTRSIIRDLLREVEESYDDDYPDYQPLIDLIEETEQFTKQGHAQEAIAVLTAITEACCEDWEPLDNYGIEASDIVPYLEQAWTEAILSTTLNPVEKQKLPHQFRDWYELHSAFDFKMSRAALEQGWDYPLLQQILQGQRPESLFNAEDRPYYADDLTRIRLRILNRQQRYEEYLNLAAAEGLGREYLTQLAYQEQFEELLAQADEKLTSMEDAFEVAKVLMVQGAMAVAMVIGQKGLFLPGHSEYPLATWLSELAEELQDPDLALATKLRAFQSQPSYLDYRRLEELAGEDWPSLQEDLLEFLEADHNTGWEVPRAKIDIFLHENRIDAAITVANRLGGYHRDLLLKVMRAAVSQRPEWVIEQGKKQAESIMDAGRAQEYDHAVTYLTQVKAAYEQQGQRSVWSDYKMALQRHHGRKYKLMGLFNQARF